MDATVHKTMRAEGNAEPIVESLNTESRASSRVRFKLSQASEAAAGPLAQTTRAQI
jgi:hypothetical protein